jgi:hypothetical protein
VADGGKDARKYANQPALNVRGRIRAAVPHLIAMIRAAWQFPPRNVPHVPQYQHECIGNPTAIEVSITFADGTRQAVCIDASMKEMDATYRSRKFQKTVCSVTIAGVGGIVLAATGQEEEEEEEPNERAGGLFNWFRRPPTASNTTISVYHGSINHASIIRKSGLDPDRIPTWATRDRAAAEDAISQARYDVQQGLATDIGIIESRIPRDEFEDIMRPLERGYPGFSRQLNSTEIVLRTRESVLLFNKYRVR